MNWLKKKDNIKNIKINPEIYPLRHSDAFTFFVCFVIFYYTACALQHSFSGFLMVDDAERLKKAIENCTEAEIRFLSNRAWHYYWICLWESNTYAELHSICTEQQFAARFLSKCYEANFRDVFCKFPPDLPATQTWLQNRLVELKEELLKQAGTEFRLHPKDPTGLVWCEKD